jgi:hypothetical protein
VEFLPGPWQKEFERWATNIRKDALIASPYITAPPIQLLVQTLREAGSASRVRVKVLTNLSVESIVRGSTDPSSLLELMDAVPHTQVSHLPGLHAKVYLADECEAIVTSGNLTLGGVFHNYEYGVRFTDATSVRQIWEDLLEYERLGNLVPRPDLERMAQTASELQGLRQRAEREIREPLQSEFRRRMGEAETELMAIRASGKTTNGIFADTVVYLLRKYGPMRTVELHPLIQQIHPDLCDDTIDRVIRGVHFGKRWKHYVRNAQQYLKRQGLIVFDGSRWHLCQPGG